MKTELIELIKNTDSLDIDEAKYWLSMLDNMDEKYIIKLYNILKKEKDSLEELEIKYQKDKIEMEERHKREIMEYREKKNLLFN